MKDKKKSRCWKDKYERGTRKCKYSYFANEPFLKTKLKKKKITIIIIIIIAVFTKHLFNFMQNLLPAR